ncbi:MAG: MFS transporter small subunit [Pseudonocardiaceae bacterium]
MSTQTTGSVSRPRVVLTTLAWAWVVVPFLYGLYQLLAKIPALFGS